MKITKVSLKNFRRLENVDIDFEENETVFVGPNNSGKTSATAAFRLFLNKPDFKIHDFSVSRIAEIDDFGAGNTDDDIGILPSIEMDLWLSINPEIEFGRVSLLISDLTADYEQVGIRIRYCAKDLKKLQADYGSAFPIQGDKKRTKGLVHFLSLPTNLSRHFALEYATLENVGGEIITHPREPEKAKKLLKSLIRVDFIDAQRNIDDQEAARSTRLSGAFAAFYKKNLQQADANEVANQVIDENNSRLNVHYEEHFKKLLDVIHGLGVPSINDRHLKLTSSLSPEVALQGNTSLLYIDPSSNHELPEAYNGLGFKNLVYMAIQVSHFHLQWIKTEEKRPLCQIIFIEEPEAHLHSQVQQVFISNIWNIVEMASRECGEPDKIPQLCISTHSSHILDAVGFNKVRYFRRCELGDEKAGGVTTLNATKVLSLRSFKPNKESASGTIEKEKETLDFLKKYMKLTHCDLFFSGAVVLVEGTVEKLLLPGMINKVAPALNQVYLTILEVGGAYAYRFASLLEFLGMPYLVITDLDSVCPDKKRLACPADVDNAVTSNSSIKFFLDELKVSELKDLPEDKKTISNGIGYITFQQPILVKKHGDDCKLLGRTFEEAFIYQNIGIFVDKKIYSRIDFTDGLKEDYGRTYQAVRKPSFKKTEFALEIVSSSEDWDTPKYISEGLLWLKSKTCPDTGEETE